MVKTYTQRSLISLRHVNVYFVNQIVVGITFMAAQSSSAYCYVVPSRGSKNLYQLVRMCAGSTLTRNIWEMWVLLTEIPYFLRRRKHMASVYFYSPLEPTEVVTSFKFTTVSLSYHKHNKEWFKNE